MPASEHVMHLLINLDEIKTDAPDYQHRYWFNKSAFTISLYPDGVCIDWENGGEWFETEPLKPTKECCDAVRKAYLLFALYYGEGLRIERYSVVQNGVRRMLLHYGNAPFFPYFESVILPGDLVLEENEFDEGKIFRNARIMSHIANSKRSDDQADKKITALFAYIHSKCRRYEVDRFMNLWTAINALYSDINLKHTKFVEDRIAMIPKEVLDQYRLSKDVVREFYTVPEKDDNVPRRLLIKLVHDRLGIRRKNSGGKERVLKEFTDAYEDYFTPFIIGYTGRNGGLTPPGEKRVPLRVKEYLYEAALSDADRIPEEASHCEQEGFAKLYNWSERAGASLLSFLTFELPYYKRCSYIHGSETTLLVSNYYSISLLACLNFFMERFLEKYIPYMFDSSAMGRLVAEYHALLFVERRNDDKMKYRSDNPELPEYNGPGLGTALNRLKNSREYSKTDWMKQVKGKLLI